MILTYIPQAKYSKSKAIFTKVEKKNVYFCILGEETRGIIVLNFAKALQIAYLTRHNEQHEFCGIYCEVFSVRHSREEKRREDETIPTVT